MKLVLVDNLVMPDEGTLAALDVHPHLGLLALAGAAQAAGHRVAIVDPKRLVRDGALPFDPGLYEAAARHILGESPGAVGFTALGCSFLFAANVAAVLKRVEPDLPILLGGPHATMLDREILERFGQFDIVVRHEADETLAAVLDRLEARSFESVEGISWRGAGGAVQRSAGRPKVADLDSLPIVPYDLYPVDALALPLLRIEAGRGCPFSCDFCSTAGFFQRSFRLKSAERLVKELDILNARYGCRDFKLDHDMFTVNRRKILEFCEAVADRGYRWRASARVDCVDDELLGRMAQAGCVNLYFGIETGSQRLQQSCGKRLDLTLVRPILDRAADVGIDTTASFITGFPDETIEDHNDTLDLLGECLSRPSCLGQLHVLAPEPGTPLYARLGDRILYDGVSGPYHSGLLGAGDEAAIRAAPQVFQTYYHYPAALPRRRHLFAAGLAERLRRLGPRVLRFGLPLLGGRVGRLAGSVWTFLEERGLELGDESFAAFVAGALGKGHPLVSLVRYALAVNTAPPPALEGEPAFDESRPHVLAPGLAVLEAMHDCSDLLRRLRRDGGILDGEDLPAETTYVVTPGTAFEVEPGDAALLSLFASPAAPTAVASELAGRALPADRAIALFEEMRRRGFIVPAAPRADRPVRRAA